MFMQVVRLSPAVFCRNQLYRNFQDGGQDFRVSSKVQNHAAKMGTAGEMAEQLLRASKVVSRYRMDGALRHMRVLLQV